MGDPVNTGEIPITAAPNKTDWAGLISAAVQAIGIIAVVILGLYDASTPDASVPAVAYGTIGGIVVGARVDPEAAKKAVQKVLPGG